MCSTNSLRYNPLKICEKYTLHPVVLKSRIGLKRFNRQEQEDKLNLERFPFYSILKFLNGKHCIYIKNCLFCLGGAWWYRGCDKSNLNGKYLSGDLPDEYIYQGMYWGEFRGPKYSLYSAKMMIRPRDNRAHNINYNRNLYQ